jgi:RimJ/RimL family protein N-acetyltransferase
MLKARTTIDNKASQKVLIRSGFTEVNDLDDDFVHYRRQLKVNTLHGKHAWCAFFFFWDLISFLYRKN